MHATRFPIKQAQTPSYASVDGNPGQRSQISQRPLLTTGDTLLINSQPTSQQPIHKRPLRNRIPLPLLPHQHSQHLNRRLQPQSISALPPPHAWNAYTRLQNNPISLFTQHRPRSGH